VAAARRGNISLSELEVKNLYFTEAGSDAKPEYLEDMAHFEEQFNSNEYEEKISGLLKRAYEHDVKHPQGIRNGRRSRGLPYSVRGFEPGRSLYPDHDSGCVGWESQEETLRDYLSV
jgi:hypothetical protein